MECNTPFPVLPPYEIPDADNDLWSAGVVLLSPLEQHPELYLDRLGGRLSNSRIAARIVAGCFALKLPEVSILTIKGALLKFGFPGIASSWYMNSARKYAEVYAAMYGYQTTRSKPFKIWSLHHGKGQ